MERGPEVYDNNANRLPPEEEQRLNEYYAKKAKQEAEALKARGGPTTFEDLVRGEAVKSDKSYEEITEARIAREPGSGFGEAPLLPNKEYLKQSADAFGSLDRGAFLTTAAVFASPIIVYLGIKDKVDTAETEVARNKVQDPEYGGYDGAQKLYWSAGKVGKRGYNISLIPQAEFVEKAGKLTDFQRQVAYNAVNEKPYTGKTTNDYSWDDKTPGYYIGALSGTPLFSTKAKFDNKDGLLSFTAPCAFDQLYLRGDPKDKTGALLRKEVLDQRSGAHLGYVYEDGPTEEQGGFGKRFSINAAALTFVKTAEGEQAPYGDL